MNQLKQNLQMNLVPIQDSYDRVQIFSSQKILKPALQQFLLLLTFLVGRSSQITNCKLTKFLNIE